MLESRSLKDLEDQAYGFATKLYRMAYVRLGNREDAEDVVQETYFKAVTALNRFKRGSNMESWLTTIMLNTLRDHIRKVARGGDLVSIDSLTSETDVLPAQLISRKSPESIVEDKEVSVELNQALRELPDFFLQPLLLRDLQDFSYKEIAGCLDIPIGTVMSRLSRARTMLQERLMGEGVTESAINGHDKRASSRADSVPKPNSEPEERS